MSQPPRRRRLDLEDVGDVIVVRFVDRKLLDEQNIQIIGEQLFSLVDEDGRRKLLLDMENVEYLSSAMLGKIFTLQRKMDELGGMMAFFAMAPEIMEVWDIIRLQHWLRVFPTRELAFEYVGGGWGSTVHIPCPTGCPGVARPSAGRAGSLVFLRCPECDARFGLTLPDVPPGGEAETTVGGVFLPTYKEQFIHLAFGSPLTIRLPARFDLFAGDVLRRLWQGLPPPRVALVDCRSAGELSEQGAAVLTELLAGEGDGKVVLLVNKDRPRSATFPAGTPLYTEEREAVAALVEVPARQPRTVKVSRPREA
jgi:anti-sigma B factor antagonist